MPINVLLVEDNPDRVEELRSLLSERVFSEDVLIATASNVHDGTELLRAQYFDLLIVDICLPMRTGDKPADDGGVRLLRFMKSRTELHLPGYIVGLTAYDELAVKFAPEFNDAMWLIVHYDRSSDGWVNRLSDHVNYILAAKTSRNPSYDYDLAVVTANYAIELESVLGLNAGWHEARLPGDDTLYHVGTFASSKRGLRVVAAAALEMGMPAATAVSMKLIQQFKPRYLAMTGIAAGVVGSFGDILIADQSWDYGSGKTRTDEKQRTSFLPAPTAIQLNPALKYDLNWFVSRRQALEKIRSRWGGYRVPKSLVAHIGPVASGASVVESKPLIQRIEGQNRKVIGVEMETYGVFLAARLCVEPRPIAMSFKSVCDFGDPDKDDAYQEYAAFTSANFLLEFVTEGLVA